jgi:hypothetical protein
MNDRLQYARPRCVARSARFGIVPIIALCLVAGATAASAGSSAVPTRLSATLRPSANQEFAKRSARGSFRAVYSPSARTLKFRLTYSGLSGPVLVAELHVGKITHAGFTGRYPLCEADHLPCVDGKWLTIKQIFPDLLVQLGRRGGYIDLHTYKNTAGEAAGKLRVTK